MIESPNYIVVRIEGDARSGKTTVGQALLNILEKNGINTRLIDGYEALHQLSLNQSEKIKNAKALKSLKDKLSVDITTSTTFGKPARDTKKLVDDLELKLELKNKKITELESFIDGYKVLTEKQRREIDYYRQELSSEVKHRIGLSVTLDMGLQK